MAVVSQPFNRAQVCPQPGKLDKSLNEIWVSSPFDIHNEGHNLSAFERNRLLLNGGGKRFLDLSYVSGTDSDGDGRAVVAADFRNKGKLDLVVRQVSGGPLQLFENQLPTRHFLNVTLRGTKSNQLGIGAAMAGATLASSFFGK